MEFKEKLKQLRTSIGISQQKLADAIFVSRSAVAKWENGLGLPSQASLEALAVFFKVSADYLKSDDNDIENVEKNQRFHKILSLVLGLFLVFGTVLSSLLTISVFSDNWGITSELCAGEVWFDNPRIELPGYDIYYSTMTWTMFEESTEHICIFKIVKKDIIGYSVSNEYTKKSLTYDHGGESKDFATLVTIPGKGEYYNIILSHSNYVPIDFFKFDTISINEISYEVLYNSFFITEAPPAGTMIIGETRIFIE